MSIQSGYFQSLSTPNGNEKLRQLVYALPPTELKHGSSIWSVVFSPDNKWIASASEDRTVRLWDVQSGDQLKVLKGHKGIVRSVVFSPDGKQIASASGDNTVRLWDVQSGDELKVFRGHQKTVRSVVFSPDGRQLAPASADGTVRLWDVTKSGISGQQPCSQQTTAKDESSGCLLM